MQVDILHKKAQFLINARNYKDAHQVCLKILQLDGRHADAYFLIGIIASSNGRMTKAIDLIERAMTSIYSNLP